MISLWHLSKFGILLQKGETEYEGLLKHQIKKLKKTPL